jgi:hypothetical protein
MNAFAVPLPDRASSLVSRAMEPFIEYWWSTADGAPS